MFLEPVLNSGFSVLGMHHQGVFRIPGSQHEISEFKSNFERGNHQTFLKIFETFGRLLSNE